MYLYTKWEKWKTKRRVLKKNLDKIGTQRQRQRERKRLAKLLANKQAVRSLLIYLEDTEVGSREGAAKVKMEWQQRCDQEREEQWGNS